MGLEDSSIIYAEIAKIRTNRPKLHGSAKNNFEMIAKLWSIYLGIDITKQDVGFLMSLLKFARYKGGDKDNLDNFVDAANYIALAGEMLDESKL